MKLFKAFCITVILAGTILSSCKSDKVSDEEKEKGTVMLSPQGTAVTGPLKDHVQISEGEYKLELVELREGDMRSWGLQPQIKVKMKFIKPFEGDSISEPGLSATLFTADGKKISYINTAFDMDETHFTLSDNDAETFEKMLEEGKGEQLMTFTNHMTYNGTEAEFKKATAEASKIEVASELKESM
jgi:hypothetical protein